MFFPQVKTPQHIYKNAEPSSCLTLLRKSLCSQTTSGCYPVVEFFVKPEIRLHPILNVYPHLKCTYCLGLHEARNRTEGWTFVAIMWMTLTTPPVAPLITIGRGAKIFGHFYSLTLSTQYKETSIICTKAV